MVYDMVIWFVVDLLFISMRKVQYYWRVALTLIAKTRSGYHDQTTRQQDKIADCHTCMTEHLI